MRRPRLELPGVPLHITQRGVNRAAVFLYDEDCAGYLQAIETAAGDNDVAIHAYALMTNHVHLLVSAGVPSAVSRMMQAVGRRHVRAFNARHGRTGTLWEGRYKSCLVDSDRYLLACLRYVELIPVRATMVQGPWEHRWSSCTCTSGCARTHALPLTAATLRSVTSLTVVLRLTAHCCWSH